MASEDNEENTTEAQGNFVNPALSWLLFTISIVLNVMRMIASHLSKSYTDVAWTIAMWISTALATALLPFIAEHIPIGFATSLLDAITIVATFSIAWLALEEGFGPLKICSVVIIAIGCVILLFGEYFTHFPCEKEENKPNENLPEATNDD